ncbi:MAG: ABC transporter permease [Lachnospiraceae bacterium]|nr:ABC transporter permease [Lachnospiraceae bacterium]
MWKSLYSLLKKDCRMMASGKFFFVALGSLLLYTLFINFGYVKFMDANANICNVYLYDPEETLGQVSPLVYPVDSLEELNEALAMDTGSGVGINMIDGKPDVILYKGAKKADCYRVDYALSLLHSVGKYTPETVGSNTPEMKQRREITCELLFIEIVAVGFLGTAAVLFKEKQMGVIRVHAIMPLSKNLFIFSKIFLFLLTDLIFATLMALFNIGFAGAGSILSAVLVQTAILSLIMALAGFGCTMLFKDFKQFSLAYLVIVIFAAIPVFLSANPSIKMAWIDYHPFYHVYMELKNAFFGMPVTNTAYYICAVCAIILLWGIVGAAFHKEMGKEG